MFRMATTALGLALAFAIAPAAVEAQSFQAGPTVTIPDGEVHEGDFYAAGGESVRVDGRLDGDLVAGAGNRVVVTGQVDGDLFAASNTVDLRGAIGDSVRAVGQTITVDAAIDGHFLSAANELIVTENARIADGIVATASRVEIDGTVEDGVRVAAGVVVIHGTVQGDANIIADRLDLSPGARITGDLDYQTRAILSPEAAAQIGGAVRYQEPPDEEPDEGGGWGVVFWFWQTLAALLTGIVLVALFRRVVQRQVASLAEETTLSALLGFAAFLLIPVVAVFAMVTLVGLPIGMAAILLFGRSDCDRLYGGQASLPVAVWRSLAIPLLGTCMYTAKLPIAVWLGDRLLGLAGRSGASPYLAMALGVPLLYLLFAIPRSRQSCTFIGWLFWLAATWLGLGAMVVSYRRYLDVRAKAA